MGLLDAMRAWFRRESGRSPSDTAQPSVYQAGGATSSLRHSVTPSLLPHDLPMMQRALELARQAAALAEVPIGAVVYETQTGRILGEGYNRREIDHDPTAHAELIAIREASKAAGDWRLNHCTLVVTLEPCAMCAGLIVNARLGRLVYGAPDPKAGATDTLYRLTNDPRLNHRVSPMAGVMGEECAAMLRDFFRGLRGRS
jgi:tRNA(adenine34) deaminase